MFAAVPASSLGVAVVSRATPAALLAVIPEASDCEWHLDVDGPFNWFGAGGEDVSCSTVAVAGVADARASKTRKVRKRHQDFRVCFGSGSSGSGPSPPSPPAHKKGPEVLVPFCVRVGWAGWGGSEIKARRRYRIKF